MDRKTHVCVTVDTEADAPENPHSSYFGIQACVPKLLDLFRTYGVKATFFVQEDSKCHAGTLFADLWRTCEKQGHEIGHHAHGILQSPPQEQIGAIQSGLETLRALGLNPVSYRGGRFHITGRLLEILEKNAIRYDSSVVPGLVEVFKNGKERCNHVGAPKMPYHPSLQDHTKEGKTRILELPINRYDKYAVGLWGGILTCQAKDVVLFDFFHEYKKDPYIITLIHSWEGLSWKIRDTVHKKSSGRVKKYALGYLRRLFNSDFLVNGAYFRQVERFLGYIAEKRDVCFTTIRETGESLTRSESG